MVDRNDFELTVDKTPVLPEEDWIEVQLVKVARKKGKFGPKLIFDFKVLDPKYDGLIVQGQQSMKIRSNPNTKANRWYAALSNKTLTEDIKLNVQECVGFYYKAFIENRVGDSRIFQNVTRIKFVKEGVADLDKETEETAGNTEVQGDDTAPEVKEQPAPEVKEQSATVKKVGPPKDSEDDTDFSDGDIPW